MGACGSRQVEVLSVGPVPAKSASSAAPAAAPVAAGVPKGTPVSMEGYGEHCFTGVVADKYMKKNGGEGSWLESAAWTTDNAKAEIVAAAVLQWATDNGADTFCHWFQPLASNGLRPGLSGQVQNKMVRRHSSCRRLGLPGATVRWLPSGELALLHEVCHSELLM
jgi:hypothetical protein